MPQMIDLFEFDDGHGEVWTVRVPRPSAIRRAWRWFVRRPRWSGDVIVRVLAFLWLFELCAVTWFVTWLGVSAALVH